MSHTERKISVVVTGSSTGSARKPNAPPAAPVVATASLCSRLLGLSGSASGAGGRPSVRSAMFRHLRSASCVASLILPVAKSGSRPIIFSTGAPSTLVSFIVSDGLSSTCFARCSASRSSCDSVVAALIEIGSIFLLGGRRASAADSLDYCAVLEF
ncbi:hypothetical protein BDSB_03550 [Burkholderia dolosa PC543]|nr:hypothetical protein BDSB_03550 [Burkholderia dolosa PC543]